MHLLSLLHFIFTASDYPFGILYLRLLITPKDKGQTVLELIVYRFIYSTILHINRVILYVTVCSYIIYCIHMKEKTHFLNNHLYILHDKLTKYRHILQQLTLAPATWQQTKRLGYIRQWFWWQLLIIYAVVWHILCAIIINSSIKREIQ
jgi:hypothetical protein